MESAWEERGHWHQQNQPFSRPTFLGLLQLAWFLRATARPPSMQPKKESSRLLEAAGMVVGSDRFTRRLLEYGLFRHYILYKQVLDKQSRFANWKSADAKGVQFCCFGWPPKKIVHFLNFAGFSRILQNCKKMQFEFSRHFTWLGSVSRLPLFIFLYTVFQGSSKTTELNTFSWTKKLW
jgi:hypothetical protein